MLNVAAVKNSLQVAEASSDVFVRSISYVYATVLSILILAYVPLFPGLYFHMLAQRKKTLAPPRPAAKAEESGIQFPKNDKGERSTTAMGQVQYVGRKERDPCVLEKKVEREI